MNSNDLIEIVRFGQNAGFGQFISRPERWLMPWGTFQINGVEVTAPDEEVWSPQVIGTDLNGEQNRSPYWRLEWRKTVSDQCRLDWNDYDNTRLESLTTRPPHILDEFETYTNVVCQSVTMRHRRSVGNEVVATFLVYAP